MTKYLIYTAEIIVIVFIGGLLQTVGGMNAIVAGGIMCVALYVAGYFRRRHESKPLEV